LNGSIFHVNFTFLAVSKSFNNVQAASHDRLRNDSGDDEGAHPWPINSVADPEYDKDDVQTFGQSVLCILGTCMDVLQCLYENGLV
jgi:hypothetical protein